jgi:hypothetical protein
MGKLAKDKQGLALSLLTASDDFDVFELADLNDTVTDTFPGGLSRRILVGTAGDVAVLRRDGVSKIIKGVVDGLVLEIGVVKILLTGTTASDFTVMY